MNNKLCFSLLLMTSLFSEKSFSAWEDDYDSYSEAQYVLSNKVGLQYNIRLKDGSYFAICAMAYNGGKSSLSLLATSVTTSQIDIVDTLSQGLGYKISCRKYDMETKDLTAQMIRTARKDRLALQSKLGNNQKELTTAVLSNQNGSGITYDYSYTTSGRTKNSGTIYRINNEHRNKAVVCQFSSKNTRAPLILLLLPESISTVNAIANDEGWVNVSLDDCNDYEIDGLN